MMYKEERPLCRQNDDNDKPANRQQDDKNNAVHERHS